MAAGVALAGLARRPDTVPGGPAAFAAALAAVSCLPDVDCASLLLGSQAFLSFHRTVTHSVPGILAASLAVAAAVRGWTSYPPRAAFLLAAAAQALHVVLDACTHTGVAALWPLSDARLTIHPWFPPAAAAVAILAATAVSIRRLRTPLRGEPAPVAETPEDAPEHP